MLRLHGLLHHFHQPRRQFVQIRLVAAGGGEGGERFGRIILLAVERRSITIHNTRAKVRRDEHR
jgi:hypothetical protein